MAGWTGLEPVASAVTGRRYNQLNYHPALSGLIVIDVRGGCCQDCEFINIHNFKLIN